MCVGSAYATLVRWGLRGSLGWSIEVLEFMLSIATGLALAYTQRERGHVAVTFLDNFLPGRIKRGVAIFRIILYIGVVVCLCHGMTQKFIKAVVEHHRTEMYRIPLLVPESIVLGGFLFLMIQLVFDLGGIVFYGRRSGDASRHNDSGEPRPL